MKDQQSDWDQRLIRLETSLKKSRLETEQRLQQVRQLEEQVVELMAALKEKTTKVESYTLPLIGLCEGFNLEHTLQENFAFIYIILLTTKLVNEILKKIEWLRERTE